MDPPGIIGRHGHGKGSVYGAKFPAPITSMGLITTIIFPLQRVDEAPAKCPL